MTKSVFCILGLLFGCVPRKFNDSDVAGSTRVSNAERDVYLAKGKVWFDGSEGLVSQRDMLRGPESRTNPGPDARLPCTFMEPDPNDVPGGRTAKFTCDFGEPLKDRKVKYDPYFNTINPLPPGRHNMEVYGEVLATRLLWALGFGADTIYTVQAMCRNCPPDPWLFLRAKSLDPKTGRPILDLNDRRMGFVRPELLDGNGQCTGRCEQRSDRLFAPAVVEKKFDGKAIVSDTIEGWGWHELFKNIHAISPAELIHRDALAIMAAFISHMDNQSTQQRLVCLDKEWGKRRKENGTSEPCPDPFLIIQDAGSNFGNGWAPFQGDLKLNKLDLEKWKKLSIWAHPEKCIITVHGAPNATFGGPLDKNLAVSDAGRAFLASLMSKLSERQIVDLFRAAHVELVWQSEGDPIREWTWAFIQKVKEQLVEKRCVDVPR